MAVLLAVPNFIDTDINEQFAYNHTERFHPALASINSIDKLEDYVDKAAALKNIPIGSAEYNVFLSYIISCRFYHGFSHLKLNENWIAAVGEKFTGIGLSCKVQPNDIMQHPYAACSQQALVMMEILKRNKSDYRKVGFPHHYALEVKSNGHWYYFDPNMEPYMNISQRAHEDWKESNDSLKKYYDATKHSSLSYQFGNGQKAEFGPVNEVPAQRLRWFQSATGLLSKILWCFPLIFLYAKRRSPKRQVVKPVNDSRYPTDLHPSFSA
ncbi:MAG: hypothetical protein ABI741_00435 [Ferruginibacter sp.]